MTFAFKVIFLLLVCAYSVPVVIGGGIHGQRVHALQVLLFSIGVTGFVTLQWLLT